MAELPGNLLRRLAGRYRVACGGVAEGVEGGNVPRRGRDPSASGVAPIERGERGPVVAVNGPPLRRAQRSRHVPLGKRAARARREDEVLGSAVQAPEPVLREDRGEPGGQLDGTLRLRGLERLALPLPVDLEPKRDGRRPEVRELQVSPQEAEALAEAGARNRREGEESTEGLMRGRKRLG